MRLWILFSCWLALAACGLPFGPRTLREARFDYGEAVARSANEQLLLNLVRLRYRDNPMFLDVGSIVAQYSLVASGGAEVGAEFDADDPAGASLGFNAEYAEQPTITYAPVAGDAFVARLLMPVSPANLVLLSQSGWSIERLLLCCVQKINGLRNAVGASGPTPDYVPAFADFHRLAGLLRKLQVTGLLEAEVIPDSVGVQLRLTEDPSGALAAEIAEARALLKLAPESHTFKVSSSLTQRSGNEIAIFGRSLLSVLFYLSQAVNVPEEHKREGRVTVTLDAQGKPFDWREATGHLLEVHSSPTRPADSAVAVAYRGAWFFIDDRDLHSKTTFSLLNYLFALKAGAGEVQEPVLTLGVR